jgi:hypothetical protein
MCYLFLWLIVVWLLLLAENIEDLIYGICLLLRVRLLALTGSRILLPEQVAKNARGPTQRIV